MIALLHLFASLLLGYALTRWLPLKRFQFEQPALTIALGFVCWTWLSFVCALIIPIAWVALLLTDAICILAAIALLNRPAVPRSLPLPGSRRGLALWAVFTLITTTILGWLMWTHSLLKEPGGIYSAAATWADFGLHASLISHIAVSAQLPLDFPVAAGLKLTYPLMVDLQSAWLLAGGLSLHLAIFIPGLLLAFAALQLLLGFGVRLTKSLPTSVLGVTMTLLSGSAVGVFQAWSHFKQSGQTIGQFLSQIPYDYTALQEPNAQFTNVLADTLLPQRAFVMGLALGAIILISLYQLNKQPSRALTITTGALLGLMPLIHAHSFVAIGSIGLGLYCSTYLHTKRWRNHVLGVGLIALAVAAPQILWQSLANGTGTGGFWSPGWVIGPNESLMQFWANNFGLTGLAIIALPIAIYSSRQLKPLLPWSVSLWALFIFANLYSLQPFAYDNLKLMIYPLIFTNFIVAYAAIYLIRRWPVSGPAVLIAIVLMTSSGALAVAREFQRHDQFASLADIQLAAWIQKNTQTTDVFATTDRPNQPVAALAGRSIVAGYRGWLYDYHINYTPRLHAIQEGLLGRSEALSVYNTRYLAVNAYEPAEWTVDHTAIESTYERVYTNEEWKVYRLP